jgi:hypothetical protein
MGDREIFRDDGMGPGWVRWDGGWYGMGRGIRSGGVWCARLPDCQCSVLSVCGLWPALSRKAGAGSNMSDGRWQDRFGGLKEGRERCPTCPQTGVSIAPVPPVRWPLSMNSWYRTDRGPAA